MFGQASQAPRKATVTTPSATPTRSRSPPWPLRRGRMRDMALASVSRSISSWGKVRSGRMGEPQLELLGFEVNPQALREVDAENALLRLSCQGRVAVFVLQLLRHLHR